jgi:hypothetical protein
MSRIHPAPAPDRFGVRGSQFLLGQRRQQLRARSVRQHHRIGVGDLSKLNHAPVAHPDRHDELRDSRSRRRVGRREVVFEREVARDLPG